MITWLKAAETADQNQGKHFVGKKLLLKGIKSDNISVKWTEHAHRHYELCFDPNQ